MLLRASSKILGDAADLHAVTDAEAPARGVAHGETLVRFAEAAVTGDEAELESARARVLEELGPDALVDASAVVGNFERMVRIADGSGIPLDAPMEMLTADLRNDLGIDRFGSAANTPSSGPLKRVLARVLRAVTLPLMRRIGRRMMRRPTAAR